MIKRALVGMLVMAVPGGIWGYVYWGWERERQALIDWGGDPSLFGQKPLGGAEFQKSLGPAGWVLNRVEHIAMPEATDADAACLKSFHSLQTLDIDDGVPEGVSPPHFTDAGLEDIKDLKELRSLGLSNTSVTDAGLANLEGLTKLTSLNIAFNHQRLTDAGLTHLRGLTNLRDLRFEDTDVDDAGLESLSDMHDLETLNLSMTHVTDRGLAHLKGLKHLRWLAVQGTSVTEAGVKDLQAAIPGLQVGWP